MRKVINKDTCCGRWKTVQPRNCVLFCFTEKRWSQFAEEHRIVPDLFCFALLFYFVHCSIESPELVVLQNKLPRHDYVIELCGYVLDFPRQEKHKTDKDKQDNALAILLPFHKKGCLRQWVISKGKASEHPHDVRTDILGSASQIVAVFRVITMRRMLQNDANVFKSENLTWTKTTVFRLFQCGQCKI